MEINEENIKSELLKRIPEIAKFNTIEIKIENKEVKFKISSFDHIFTCEVDIENKNLDELLKELTPQIKNLINKVNEKVRRGE